MEGFHIQSNRFTREMANTNMVTMLRQSLAMSCFSEPSARRRRPSLYLLLFATSLLLFTLLLEKSASLMKSSRRTEKE